jgi:hypothetical protein
MKDPNMNLIDEHAASEFLCVSLSTLRRDRASSKLGIPLVRIGAAVRYRRLDLTAWVEAQMKKSAAQPTQYKSPATPMPAPQRQPGRPRKVWMPEITKGEMK